MTREQHEQGEQSHYEEVLGLPRDTVHGYYPGEEQYLKEHPEADKPAVELDPEEPPF